jgi:hypothetical protein
MKPRIFALAATLLLAVVLIRATHRIRVASQPETQTIPPATDPGQQPARSVNRISSRAPQSDVVASPNPSPSATNNWLARLMSTNPAIELPRETIDRWLASGRTNAEDLLAARQAGGGTEFLRMALTNFPNDPRVLLAAVALNDGPEATRERLDRFKAAAPDNAMADYLSARDHLKNGRPDEAIADLLAATGKSGFNDYTLDAMQNAEDLYLQSGKSPAEAKMLGVSTALLPQLAQFKGLAQDMAALQRQYMAGGDTASAENLARMGMQLGQQLVAGESSRTLISQLVGAAIERIVLNPLDPAKTYDFLQGSPRDRFAQLDAYRAEVKQNTQFFQQWVESANDADLISYSDRLKLYGESAALKWLQTRQKRVDP